MRKRKIGFWLKIALPLLVATLGVFWLTYDLLGRVRHEANYSDHLHTRNLVSSALQEKQNALITLANDNAYWDDAAKHIYGTVDPVWSEETWAATTESGAGFNMLAVVERGNNGSLVAFHNGKSFEFSINDYFKGKLDSLLADSNENDKTRGSKAAILETADGLAIVAASPVAPTSKDFEGATAPLRHLVMVNFLTDEVITAIGEQYIINDLKLNAPSQDSNVVSLNDSTGTPIASLSWRDTRPGDAAYAIVIDKTWLALGFLALVMIGTAFQCWAALRKIVLREEIAQHAARHDTLTGLKNRNALMAELDSYNKDKFENFTLVFADIDGFKDVNDTYDHGVGDSLIRFIASGVTHLASNFSAEVARIGGDEFVAVFKGDDGSANAKKFADAFIAFLAAPIEIDGRFASVGVSIGIAHSNGMDVTGAEAMRQADVAMYEAKREGKNRWVVYNSEMDRHSHVHLALQNGLQQIIAENSVDIAFQPIVDAGTKKIVAVEALARWPKHIAPHFTPDKFINFAEVHGLIGALGDSILRKTCEQAKNWHDLRISYNLSPVQLRDPNFVDRALKIISESGMAPGRFEFEVTESVLVHDMGLVQAQLERLRSVGIHIALDDFGSGYSSVGYLQKLTFDRIKLDRSIIEHVASNQLDQGIAMGTVLMARGMGAVVTAEGIETEDQAVMLRAAGCSEFQGYYFHKPMPDQSVDALLKMQVNANLHELRQELSRELSQELRQELRMSA